MSEVDTVAPAIGSAVKEAEPAPSSADTTAEKKDGEEKEALDARIRNIAHDSSPEIIVLISEYFYRNEPAKTKAGKSSKPKRRGYHRRQSDPDYVSEERDFYLPTDLGRLIHQFVFVHGRELTDYELVKVVGRGSYGKVFAVWDKDEIRMLGKEDSKMYAMKVIKKNRTVTDSQEKHIMDELRFYKMIAEESQCPYLVRMHYAFETDTRLCFILDFYDGGDLFQSLRASQKLSEQAACVVCAEVTSALMHLHDKFDIVHRNLKPEVVMLQKDGHCILIDLGLSKQIPDGKTSRTVCGTPEYIAPEILNHSGHGKPVDWWAMGVLLYELVVGFPPFYSQNVREMYQKILTATVEFPSTVGEQTKDLITKLLNRDVSARLGTKSSEEIKNHPFWTEVAPGSFKDSHDFWHKLTGFQVIPPLKPQSTEDDPFANFKGSFMDEKVVITPIAYDEDIDERFHSATKSPFEYW